MRGVEPPVLPQDRLGQRPNAHRHDDQIGLAAEVGVDLRRQRPVALDDPGRHPLVAGPGDGEGGFVPHHGHHLAALFAGQMRLGGPAAPGPAGRTDRDPAHPAPADVTADIALCLRYAARHVPPREVVLAAWPGQTRLIERLLGPAPGPAAQ
jgi:hypothetical protein